MGLAKILHAFGRVVTSEQHIPVSANLPSGYLGFQEHGMGRVWDFKISLPQFLPKACNIFASPNILVLVIHFTSKLSPLEGFPGDSDGKESTCNVGDLGSIPGLGRSPGERNPLQYSCLENSMDKGDWKATAKGVAKSQTRLSDFH